MDITKIVSAEETEEIQDKRKFKESVQFSVNV